MNDREIDALVDSFIACTLPRERWTHSAHLIVGLWHLERHGEEEALALLRERIVAYNVSVGTANTDTSGYHETITRFYVIAIGQFLRSCRKDRRDRAGLFRALLESPLSDRDLPLRFYSRAHLFSVEARKGWARPDLKDIEVF